MGKREVPFIQTAKDVKKLIRSIIQLIILIYVSYLIINAFISLTVYVPYPAPAESNADHGFIVLSYAGVDRKGIAPAIRADRFEAHIKALRDSGYVTVSQQDIIDYYKEGKTLPEKSLLLIFEGGDRKTSIFAQKIMEKYNYKATMLTLAGSFSKTDSRLLTGRDIRDLNKSSFWEMGTYGYRIEYINVFDRYGDYLGRMDVPEFKGLREQVANDYDYYLMDYIRDERRLPLETYEEMSARIRDDYDKMRDVYAQEMGEIPKLYALLSPNSGAFGHNGKVSSINREQIYGLFGINVNRVGRPHNDRNHSIYDLTRNQPQPYWPVNHLLMRIWDDSGQELAFVTGDSQRAGFWDELLGKAEFIASSIVLTSLPGGEGLIKLKGSEGYLDFDLSVRLNGNKYGSQSILLRMDESLQSGISVTIKDNQLHLLEISGGRETNLFSLDLDVHDGLLGGKIPNMDEAGSRLVEISLSGEKLSVNIDGRQAAGGITVSKRDAGPIYLLSKSSVSGSGSSSNDNALPDNIYDGIFDDIVIKKAGDETVLFNNTLQGFEAVLYEARGIGQTVANWFIESF